MTASTRLAAYLTTQQEWPATGLHDMKRLLIDYIGVALAGSATDSGRIAGDYAIARHGAPQSTLIGRGVKVAASDAALANAIAEHSIELDDIDVEALFHHGPPVYSAALAVAEATGATGRQLLTAALAGCETMNRVSRAANPSLRNRGFHTTPTCGVFGAAAAAGLLLGLDEERLVSALGLAGAQSSGLMEMYGTSMQKRFNPGPAARNGVDAAYLASLGFTGADTILDGERGFGAAFTDSFEIERITERLGEEVIVAVEFKPYSSARPIHNAIDCALAIRAEGVAIGDIASLVVRRHPTWSEYHVIPAPRTYHEAQVSLPYSVAVAFADGAALFDQYSDDRIAHDRAVMELSARVVVETDPSLPRGVSVAMTVTTTDGAVHTAQVDYAKGSLENPMSDDELVAKFRMLGAAAKSPEQLDEIARIVFSLDEVEDLGPLFSLLA